MDFKHVGTFQCLVRRSQHYSFDYRGLDSLSKKITHLIVPFSVYLPFQPVLALLYML